MSVTNNVEEQQKKRDCSGLHLTIVTLGGESFDVDVPQDAKIADVKAMLQAEHGLHSACTTLVWGLTPLDKDDQLLAEAGLENGDTLTLQKRAFKLALVGDTGVGKTALAVQFMTTTGDASLTDEPQLHHLRFATGGGGGSMIDFDVWEGSVNESTGRSLGADFFCRCDCAVIMFDVTSRVSYKSVPTYFREIKSACGDIPVILVGNKVDDRDRKVKPKFINFHRKHNLQYYDVSAIAHYNILKPFEWLARRLLNNVDCNLTPECVASPELHLDPEMIRKLDMSTVLPEEHEDFFT